MSDDRLTKLVMQSPGKAVDGSRSESWFAVVAADGWLVDGWRRVQAEDAERHAAWCDRNLSRGAPHSVIQVTQTTSIRYDAPPPAAPAVSPEPGHDGHTHDVGPVKVWRCILSAPDCLGVDDANRLHIGCGWVDAVPSPEPERDEP